MLFVQIRPTKSSMLSSGGKWRLSQMSKHFPVNITILDTGHFINFNIHFLLHCCLVFLWYLFTKHEGNITEAEASRS